jgi:hypothetical protein
MEAMCGSKACDVEETCGIEVNACYGKNECKECNILVKV